VPLWPPPARLAKIAQDNTIFVTSATCAYADLAVNWIKHVWDLQIGCFFVAAADEPTATFLEKWLPDHASQMPPRINHQVGPALLVVSADVDSACKLCGVCPENIGLSLVAVSRSWVGEGALFVLGSSLQQCVFLHCCKKQLLALLQGAHSSQQGHMQVTSKLGMHEARIMERDEVLSPLLEKRERQAMDRRDWGWGLGEGGGVTHGV